MTHQSALELRDIDFERISRLVYEQCGINLHEGKKELVKARLGKRLREGRFLSFKDYFQHVTSQEGTDELISMIDSLSTNLTYFFREESHFHALTGIVTAWAREAREQRRPFKLRVWSAGCSTGEEPYSLAMTVRECPLDPGAEIRIVATDISTKVLAFATQGIYPQEKLRGIPQALLRKYFQIGSGASQGYYRVKRELRELIHFSRFNLMTPPPSDFTFDVIFCRNVMIYFDKETQANLIRKFHHCLNRGGYFFTGHSESLTGLDHDFKYMEPSIYRK